jgi:glyoxylase-like metal-dependent hydrolase (beta-lactamase superfamily II)
VELEDRRLGRATTVLFGERGGKYPQGNSLLVAGAEEALLLDPSLGMVPRRGRLPRVDRIVNSHCHEDHVAGNHLFPAVPCSVHEADLPGLHSLEGFLAIFGYTGPIGSGWQQALVEQFHYAPRPDATGFRDHTRGHCAFHVEPDDVLYLGDIDLSSFGPYYGDAWSDLEDFERSLARVRGLEARWYATFHHIGVLEGRAAFLERLDRFSAVIGDREARLLAFLAEPRSLDEIAAHRFVYRPSDPVPFAEPVERRSMAQHVARLARDGRVREVAPGRFRAA